jgi:hypothetical protein
MKKMVLGVALSLAALAFLMSPAPAAASPSPAATVVSVADQAFLASLAAAPAGTPAPELAAKRPGIRPKATCTALCGDGSNVSCSGSSCTAVNANNCPTELGHVTCDGFTTTCGSSTCPICGQNFCTGEDACANTQCAGCEYTYTCNTTTCTDHCHCILRTCF